MKRWRELVVESESLWKKRLGIHAQRATNTNHPHGSRVLPWASQRLEHRQGNTNAGRLQKFTTGGTRIRVSLLHHHRTVKSCMANISYAPCSAFRLAGPHPSQVSQLRRGLGPKACSILPKVLGKNTELTCVGPTGFR